MSVVFFTVFNNFGTPVYIDVIIDHAFEMNIRAKGENIYREKHGLTYLDHTIRVRYDRTNYFRNFLNHLTC